MKYSLEISKSIFIDKLQDFKSANAVNLAAEHEFINFDLDHGTSDEFKAVRKKLQIARLDLEYCAVAFCKFLEANTDVLEDVPADAPEDASADVPEDAPEDVPVDATEDAPEDVLADTLVKALAHTFFNALTDAPVDVPVQSAKCKICPCSVDGRCFFVPDQYDSDFPCQSPAWDDFFKSGGSRSPAPRARASPL